MKMKPGTINIGFQDVTYTVRYGKSELKRILNCVSGDFKSGELTAIMGPSGAGKSTLLNILTGFTRNGVSGEITMKDNAANTYRKQCSYILQDDNLYNTFDVQETMILSANLKIASIGKDKRNIIINDILSTLHLQHTRTTKCGLLSGGERKRLSIALELLDNPPVLFLDEPTTGLDSSAAAYCVQLMHNLAREGRTIICTIHQPAASIYEIFDHVYVLAQGNCVYQGTPDNTVTYLSEIGLICPHYHNSADFLFEVINGDYGDFFPQLKTAAKDIRWRSSISAKSSVTAGPGKTMMEVKSTHRDACLDVPNEWTRLWFLIGRCRILYHRDWTVTYLKLVLHILVATLIGLLYGDSGINAAKAVSNVGLLLLGVMYLWYTSLLPSILKFPAEIAILKKETFNNWYKLKTYFVANLIVALPINILFSIIYTTIVILLTSQQIDFRRFCNLAVVYILNAQITEGLGLIIGTYFTPINGTFVGMIYSAFALSFCGILAIPSHVSEPVRHIMKLSSMSYVMEALFLALYEDNSAEWVCPETELYCHFKNAKLLETELAIIPGNYYIDVWVTLAQVVLFRIVAFFMLKRRLRCDTNVE